MRAPLRVNPITRNRAVYASAAVLVIGAGLFWRSRLLPLPANIEKYGGDSLWALVVFLGCGFVWPRRSTSRVALLAVAIAWSVEFSQLYHSDWIDGIRAHRLGRLVLGTTFNAPDLVAYLAGIAIGAIAERRLRRIDGQRH